MVLSPKTVEKIIKGQAVVPREADQKDLLTIQIGMMKKIDSKVDAVKAVTEETLSVVNHIKATSGSFMAMVKRALFKLRDSVPIAQRPRFVLLCQEGACQLYLATDPLWTKFRPIDKEGQEVNGSAVVEDEDINKKCSEWAYKEALASQLELTVEQKAICDGLKLTAGTHHPRGKGKGKGGKGQGQRAVDKAPTKTADKRPQKGGGNPNKKRRN
jgi:hypothetical protein